MACFILRYYYFLKDDISSGEGLIKMCKDNSFTAGTGNVSSELIKPAGVYFELPDSSNKMVILGVKTPDDADGWIGPWAVLQEMEDKAAFDSDDLMGKLTVLVSPTGKRVELLDAAAAVLPKYNLDVEYISESQIFRLPINKRDTEAIYVYEPQQEKVAGPLLARKLPLLHGQMIFLNQLDMVMRDRNLTICREKDSLEKELIRILHTKLVMNQPSLDINKELENDIEGLASAFAKLVGDKKIVNDGIKRQESMLKGIERQFINEPAFQLNENGVAEMMSSYHERLDQLRLMYDDLSLVEDNYQAAIEVVQSKIQVMNSRTNIATQEQIRELLKINTEMQKKSLVYQYAAGLIEFIVLAYYSFSIWRYLAYKAAAVIPSWIQFIFIFLFSGAAVMLTDYMAEYLQGEHHVRQKLIITAIFLALVLITIFVGTYFASLAPVSVAPTAH
jgi:hypothetical protein